MCGFSGIISGELSNSDSIENSLRSIKHRGPDNTLISDTTSFYASALSNSHTANNFPKNDGISSKIWIGFNRLSIVDFSENAMQPFYDKKEDCYFMLNGEIYNYKELREKHLSDYDFISNSDSEVAFKLYLKYGNNFVNYLQGMFSIVIISKREESIKIWRDRMGIKPFYYHHSKNQFIFSSEVKGILSTGLVEKKPDYQGLAYSMYLGTCPAPITIYKNIFSLQPGHRLEYSFNEHSVIIEPYWVLKYKPTKNKIDYREFSSDTKQLCELYSTGEAEKAIMLSGGIDSGTLAYFYGLVNSNLKALTIFQKDSSNNELEYAISNAENAGLEIQEFEVPATLDDTTRDMYLSSEEEPNFSPEPAIFISQKAKQQNIRVLYNALGPDEIFGGYDYFAKIRKLRHFEFLLNFIPTFILPFRKRQKLKELKAYGLQNFPFISRSQFSWHEICNFLTENDQDIPEHPIRFINSQIETLYPDFTRLPKLKQMSYLEIFYYISSHHTLRSDIPSMMYSIEMRFPFLEHTFIEKYFNQTHLFANLDKELKPQMRNFARNHLTPKVMSMPKKGFSIDLNEGFEEKESRKAWYRSGIKKIFDDVLI